MSMPRNTILSDAAVFGGSSGSFDFLPYDHHPQAAISENVRGQGMEAGPLSILHSIQNKSSILFAILCNTI
jgi:hypothetical protein